MPTELDRKIEHRAQVLLHENRWSLFKRTDRVVLTLLAVQWLAGVLIAAKVFQQPDSGNQIDVHLQIWTVSLFVALVVIWPLYLANNQAEAKEMSTSLEDLVEQRTQDLNKAKIGLSVQYEVASALADGGTSNEAIAKSLLAISSHVLSNCGYVWGAFWSNSKDSKVLHCVESIQVPDHSFSEFARVSRNFTFAEGEGLDRKSVV